MSPVRYWAIVSIPFLFLIIVIPMAERSRRKFGERCTREREARDAANPHRPPSSTRNMAER